jgi:hypothetical protein
MGRVVVVDSGAAVEVVEAEPGGSVGVVVSESVVDVVAGVDDVTVLGVGSEVQATATSTTTSGITTRCFISIRFDETGRLSGSVGFMGDAASLHLINARQQVDADDEEDDQPEHSRP